MSKLDGAASVRPQSVTISELYSYPIKSLPGLSLNTMELLPDGPRFDRQWLLIDEMGRFLTQRQLPQLSQFKLNLFSNKITLEYQDQGQIAFRTDEFTGESIDAFVWRSEMPAYEVRSEVSQWFSQLLQREVRLVRLSDQATREFHPDFPDRYVRFVDQHPLLILSEASLELLSTKVGRKMEALRFRPNIVLKGSGPHDEDGWESIRSDGGIEFKAIKPCSRCTITTVDLKTGKSGPEPLKTLASYRRSGSAIAFGYYFAHTYPGVLHVGQKIIPK
jgi:uncharacterized protein YcbX